MEEETFVLLAGIYFFVYGAFILKRGWAKRWELIPLFGLLGASILGDKRLTGTGHTFAFLVHFAIGLFFVIGSFNM